MSFSLYDADSTIPSTIEQECRKIHTSRLPNFKEYLQLPEYVNLLKLLKKGIGIHHAGVLAVFREMVEMMQATRYFESFQKAMSTSAELDQKLNQSAKRS